MVKNHYIQELKTDSPLIRKGQKGMDVIKVQEWINLWQWVDTKWKIGIARDGDFGRDTEAAVRKFQDFHGLSNDGIVGNNTWRKLTEPMRKAFTRIENEKSLRKLIVAYARQHLANSPREFKSNIGPWVRAYMDGNQGHLQPWCMGFAQTILDQAAFTIEDSLISYMPRTVSCDVLGKFGLKNGQLIEKAKLKPDLIEPGDFFLVYAKAKVDWIHVGIVTGVEGDWIQTIEGNTNDSGSREGIEVCERERNYDTKKIDIYRVT